MEYKAKSWDFPATFIGSLSRTSLDEHVKLYQGYVKHYTLIRTILDTTKPAIVDDTLAYTLAEVSRRMPFEWNGIKNHEYYFEQIAGGAVAINTDSALAQAIITKYTTWNDWILSFTTLAKTRGIGWAILWRDRESGTLLQSWVDEQHLGQMSGCDFIFGIDMWEHSFVYDYQPSGKAHYIADYLANVNWSIVEKRFEEKKAS